MEGSQDKNQSSNGASTAPPPPQEVKIRTMKSDLASVAESGGGLPQFQNVKIALGAQRSGDGKNGQKGNLLAIIIAVVAVLVVAAVAYFGYQALQKKNAPVTVPSAAGQ